MRRKTKMIIAYGLLCIMMLVTGFLGASYYYRNAAVSVSATTVETSGEDDYGTGQFRTERQQLRAMQKSQINEIIYGSQSDPEIASAAQERLLELLKCEELENTLEGMLEMRGFKDVVVSVHGDGATVMVCIDLLTKQESGVILDLVCRQTGFLSGNIKIIPIN